MRQVARVAQIRAAEEAFFQANPDVDLMQRAAAQVAEMADSMIVPGGTVLVAAGPGNNGGDGLYAASRLAKLGFQVYVWLPLNKTHEAGLSAALQAGATLVDSFDELDVDLVIDAVFGIGGRPGIPANMVGLADFVEYTGAPVLAVDIPSGLDADSHRVSAPCLPADVTVTFGAFKFCQVAYPAKAKCGEVRLPDIGLKVPETAIGQLDELDVGGLWPVPDHTSDKYSRGVLGIDSGSRKYFGAALLNLSGALHAGAGMVRYAGPVPKETVVSKFSSVTIGVGKVQAWLVGSGWGGPDKQRLEKRVSDDVPMVIDAEAIDSLEGLKLPENSLLTPHAGELARLLRVERFEVEDDPIGSVKNAANKVGATVLLKGATQFVSDGENVIIATEGSAWSAQAGSGDVLAGICGTLLAAMGGEYPAILIGALGASIQAMAARSNPGPHTPEEAAKAMAELIGRLV